MCVDLLGTLIKLFIILYADDTIIMCESVEGMKNALEKFEEYCNVWNLKGQY